MAKSYNQREGIDFKEAFSPVSTKDFLRIIMAVVTHFDLELHKMDVGTTFFNGYSVEDVYMFNLLVLRRLLRKTWFVSSINPFMVLSRLPSIGILSLMKLSPPMVLRRTSWINAYI